MSWNISIYYALSKYCLNSRWLRSGTWRIVTPNGRQQEVLVDGINENK